MTSLQKLTELSVAHFDRWKLEVFILSHWYLKHYQLHFAQWFPDVTLSTELFNVSSTEEPAFKVLHPLDHLMTSYKWGYVCSLPGPNLTPLDVVMRSHILVFEVWLGMHTESPLLSGICVLLIAMSKEQQMVFVFRGSAHQEIKLWWWILDRQAP